MKKGHLVGYVRVSSADQNPERQFEGLGTELDKIFSDKESGKDMERPGLAAMLDYIREGDTLIALSMDRLARNSDELKALVKRLTKAGITVKFVKEQLTFTGEDSAISQLMFSLLAAFAEFERAIIRERQREGIDIAKKKKLYKGRKPKLSNEQISALYERFRVGENKTKLIKELNISRATLYKHYSEYRAQKEPCHVCNN
jgi:DNA invertase Pin-like site-specific DNA recombinase